MLKIFFYFLVERTFSLVPANLEFIMEVGPSSITIDALEASVLTNASGNSSNGNGDPNGKYILLLLVTLTIQLSHITISFNKLIIFI